MTRGSKALACVAAAVGIIAGAALHSRLGDRTTDSATKPQDARPDDLASIAAKIQMLHAALDEERSQRAALELELEFLRRELDQGDDVVEAPPAAPVAPEIAAADAARDPASGPSAARKEWFDRDALRERGVDDRRAEWLNERFEALQMEELYLRDRAVREDWVDKPRHRFELQQLRDNAREIVGPEDYDWLLYASGRANRVIVRDVLENSPANAAGIRPGDLILRYDDVVVLGPTDLTTATTDGEAGSIVAVEVQRDGDVQRLYVSRGPLGARIGAVRRPPLGAP